MEFFFVVGHDALDALTVQVPCHLLQLEADLGKLE